jgi:hypothetical protein
MAVYEDEALRLAPIIVEGATDRFCGRPADRNPYTKQTAGEWWDAWNVGWHEADYYLESRGQEEARRWLRAS